MTASQRKPGEIRVGIGGWTFPPWRGVFYPADLPQARELEYASRQLTAIEINATYHGTQKAESFRRWRATTPDDFVFTAKGPRFATQRTRLGESGPSIERFFGSGILELGEKLGPILWQLSARHVFDEANLAAFLKLLPMNSGGRPIRHAIEARHESFAEPRCLSLLRDHGVALAVIDAEDTPIIDEATAEFSYFRLKRAAEEVPTGYDEAALGHWAERARATGRPCFVYFINGAKVRAPAAATAFLERLSA